MINKLKRFSIILALLTAMVLQSGCIIGAASSNPSLVIGGGAMAVIGTLGSMNGHNAGHGGGRDVGAAFAVVGIALDEQNPGRMDAINPFPLDEETAARLSTDIATLELYNDELNEVIGADNEIQSTLLKVFSGDENINMVEVNKMARRMGLENANELIEIIEGDLLSRDALATFSAEFQMSVSTAELYLRSRWKIKIEEEETEEGNKNDE